MNKSEIAWAGGLFEGEGHVGRNGTYGSIASVGMTDLDAIIRFRRAVGFGRIDGPIPGSKDHYKPVWVWRVSSFERVQALVGMLWPFLGRRRRIAALYAVHDDPAYEDWDLAEEDAMTDAVQMDDVELLNALDDWKKP